MYHVFSLLSSSTRSCTHTLSLKWDLMLGWYPNYIISQEGYSVATLRNGELHQSALVGRVLAGNFCQICGKQGGGFRTRGPRVGGEGSRANMGKNLRCGGCLPVLYASDMNVTLQEISLLTHQQCAFYLSPATMKLLQQVQKTIRDRWLLLTDTSQNPVDYPSNKCRACTDTDLQL